MNAGQELDWYLLPVLIASTSRMRRAGYCLFADVKAPAVIGDGLSSMFGDVGRR
jgi:hypothetical protein